MQREQKSMLIAYLVWFFLGGLGVHRMYLGKVNTGIILLLVTVATAWFTSGVPTFIWIIVDAFLIPRMVRAVNSSGEQTR